MKWIFLASLCCGVRKQILQKHIFSFWQHFSRKNALDCHRNCKNYYSWSNDNMTSHGVMLTFESNGGNETSSVILDSSPWKAIKLTTTLSKKENQARRPKFFLQPSKYPMWRHKIQKNWSSFRSILSTFNVLFLKIVFIYQDKGMVIW